MSRHSREPDLREEIANPKTRLDRLREIGNLLGIEGLDGIRRERVLRAIKKHLAANPDALEKIQGANPPPPAPPVPNPPQGGPRPAPVSGAPSRPPRMEPKVIGDNAYTVYFHPRWNLTPAAEIDYLRGRLVDLADRAEKWHTWMKEAQDKNGELNRDNQKLIDQNQRLLEFIERLEQELLEARKEPVMANASDWTCPWCSNKYPGTLAECPVDHTAMPPVIPATATDPKDAAEIARLKQELEAAHKAPATTQERSVRRLRNTQEPEETAGRSLHISRAPRNTQRREIEDVLIKIGYDGREVLFATNEQLETEWFEEYGERVQIIGGKLAPGQETHVETTKKTDEHGTVIEEEIKTQGPRQSLARSLWEKGKKR